MASPLAAKLPGSCWRRGLAACAVGMPLAVACAGADSESGSPSSVASDSPVANGIVEPAGATSVEPSFGTPTATSEHTEQLDTTAPVSIAPVIEPPIVSTAPDVPGPVDTVSTASTTMGPLGGDETVAGDTSDAPETPEHDGSFAPSSTGTTDAGTSDGPSTDESFTDSVESTTTNEAEGGVTSECPHSGTVRYTFNNADTWPSDVVERLTDAMDEAIFYYNCYSNLSHDLTVNYNESVPTAEANVDGWISFGSNRGYMVVATAMHEIGHTMGVGFSPWNELLDNGRWTGAAVSELMSTLPPAERDSDMYSQRDYITGDGQHFWPYGLNQASEHQSEWSLINHVRIVAAMQQDKEAYRSGGR